MAENILKLLQKAREDKDNLDKLFKELEDKIRDVNDQILMKEGEIKAFTAALDALGIETKDRNNGSFSDLSKNKTNETIKKPRAQRATKEDMKQRYHAVGKIFLEKGDLSVKDLEPLLNEALGYELEPHRQRGILYGSPNIFERKEDHGIWGLTAEGRAYFGAQEADDVETE